MDMDRYGLALSPPARVPLAVAQAVAWEHGLGLLVLLLGEVRRNCGYLRTAVLPYDWSVHAAVAAAALVLRAPAAVPWVDPLWPGSRSHLR